LKIEGEAMTDILGISAFYHDSAACLVRDGKIIAAAQEERFTRKKHDAGFPTHAVRYCLREGGISLTDLRYVAFYDKPLVKFERLLETYLAFAPRGFRSFLAAMPIWSREKLLLKTVLKKELVNIAVDLKKSDLPQILFGEHHESHAASAFFPSPFRSAAVLCMDGVGEWATTSAWLGEGRQLTPLWEIPFPHSLGLLYSAFTYYTGFKVNSGEYKVMGLAPYGEPRYVKAIYDSLMDLKPDGTFRMNMEYFNYCTGLTMTNRKFNALFGGPPREPESPLTQREMDLARSIQEVTEEVMLRLARTVHRETGAENLCMAGGVALNCVGNGRILRESPFKGLWIQPAAGDAGGAVGAALSAWHQLEERPRESYGPDDTMQGSFLGPSFSNEEIEDFLNRQTIPYTRLSDQPLFERVARDLNSGKVVGWFNGRMEFGPRALGGRTILGDARNSRMQSVMNLKIKYRESFRPFAPTVLRERVSDYFDLNADSPYMLLVAPVLEKRRTSPSEEQQRLWGIDLLNVPRSDIPAVTHIDYSARIQTVHEKTNPRYHGLLKAFEALTGCGVLVNTSFNVRGEPIVCTPEDAYRCFMRTEIDVLVLENCVLEKANQKPLLGDTDWKKEFALD
jgi:carbamoyltransferase